MVRGVNKRIIEITNTGNDCFERVFVVLKENLGGRSDADLIGQADGYVRELARAHRAKEAHKKLPVFAGFSVSSAKNSGMGIRTGLGQRTRFGRFCRRVLPWITLAAAAVGAVLFFFL